MGRSFLKLYTLDVGIRTDHLLTMGIRLPDTKYPAPRLSRRPQRRRRNRRRAAGRAHRTPA
ncbi:MAG: hypothetical protein A3H96_01605 [Acidobacteria bacterium RIFCSPLOWO2_02_FULL_67_36]|nr:MAG: hypothetical protein A3H96_01605 [Acidobacteria bacterium RIFCSPLOWO2_02_FULL_67_36]OFW19903.1 MAG: hypothetical protein A3G21_09795 [Acidobacteria bacterium RIFCSPLOWO2_12_FULL_66_21]